MPSGPCDGDEAPGGDDRVERPAALLERRGLRRPLLLHSATMLAAKSALWRPHAADSTVPFLFDSKTVVAGPDNLEAKATHYARNTTPAELNPRVLKAAFFQLLADCIIEKAQHKHVRPRRKHSRFRSAATSQLWVSYEIRVFY